MSTLWEVARLVETEVSSIKSSDPIGAPTVPEAALCLVVVSLVRTFLGLLVGGAITAAEAAAAAGMDADDEREGTKLFWLAVGRLFLLLAAEFRAYGLPCGCGLETA